MTTRYVDLENGNDSNNGSSFALRKKTLSSAVSGLTGGDSVRVMASADPTSLGQTATWTNGSDTVTLTSAVTANIHDCEAAWTAATNVTATASSSVVREGTNSANLVIATAFTTGLVAYKALAGSTDFSAYQQITFWFRSTGTHAAGVFQIKLCSDTAGATPVNTVDIPAIGSGNWGAFTVDTGGALGAAIQSVALYAVSDPGSVTVNLDNILAAKAASSADSLTLTSLIGKNTGSEAWFAIESINGTTVKLFSEPANVNAHTSGVVLAGKYWGTTETVTTYKREPILIAAQTIGTGASNPDAMLTVEGGYNRTDMSTKTDRTYVRTKNPADAAITLNFVNCVNVVSFGLTSCGNYGLQFFQGDFHKTDDLCLIATYQGINGHQQAGPDFVLKYAVQCFQVFYFTGSWNARGGRNARCKADFAWGLTNNSVASNTFIYDNTSVYAWMNVECPDIRNFGTGLLGASSTTTYSFRNTTFTNIGKDFNYGYGDIYYYNVTPSASPYGNAAGAYNAHYYTRLNGDQTQNGVVAIGRYWIASSATDQRHTASDFSWKLALSSTVYSRAPAELSICKVACVANEQRTVTVYMRKDHATSITARLRVRGGTAPGIATDITSAMSNTANAWEQVTIQFTPTDKCVVEIWFEAYGGVQNAWADDLGVS